MSSWHLAEVIWSFVMGHIPGLWQPHGQAWWSIHTTLLGTLSNNEIFLKVITRPFSLWSFLYQPSVLIGDLFVLFFMFAVTYRNDDHHSWSNYNLICLSCCVCLLQVWRYALYVEAHAKSGTLSTDVFVGMRVTSRSSWIVRSPPSRCWREGRPNASRALSSGPSL